MRKNSIIMLAMPIITLAGTIGAIVWLALDPTLLPIKAGMAITSAILSVVMAYLSGGMTGMVEMMEIMDARARRPRRP